MLFYSDLTRCHEKSWQKKAGRKIRPASQQTACRYRLRERRGVRTGVRSNARRATRVARGANRSTASRADRRGSRRNTSHTNGCRATVAKPSRVKVDRQAIATIGITEHL